MKRIKDAAQPEPLPTPRADVRAAIAATFDTDPRWDLLWRQALQPMPAAEQQPGDDDKAAA